MKKLIIYTQFSSTIIQLLKRHDLIESYKNSIINEGFIVLDYPNDAPSQELELWFALAEGCGLATGHRLDS